MPSQVLGKVSVTPRGDYNASTTYYALDIVGYEGGSYLAMKEVTGVTPSNDEVNWMQLSGPGLPGDQGPQGEPGAAAGFGTVSATVYETTGTPSVDVEASGPDTAKNFTFAFTGLKGNPGETPDIEIGTVNTLEPGQDATADITGTTPNLTLSLGIPKGQPGTSVSRIQRTDGTGAAGTTDTYTMYDSNDDAIGTFTVYNGANGSGAGDLMADGSVPMTGALNMGGNKVTNLGAPGADTDAVRKSDLDAVAAEVDGILDGTTPAHLAPATEAKIGGVIIGEGLSVTEDGTVSADDQLPTGGTQGQVLTQGATGPAWQDAPSGLPDGGTPGQVLTQGSSGPEWTDAPDPLPTGGTDGQVLTKTTDGATWENVPSEIPAGGTTGQVLTNGESGPEWADNPGMTQTAADARYLQLSGGTMTGALTLNGNPSTDNQAANKAYVDSKAPKYVSVTLSASGWASNSQTVTVQGVVADETAQFIQPMPAIASQAAYMAAGIYCSGQAANSLTFTCQTAPTENITVYVVMQEVSAA